MIKLLIGGWKKFLKITILKFKQSSRNKIQTNVTLVSTVTTFIPLKIHRKHIKTLKNPQPLKNPQTLKPSFKQTASNSSKTMYSLWLVDGPMSLCLVSWRLPKFIFKNEACYLWFAIGDTVINFKLLSFSRKMYH